MTACFRESMLLRAAVSSLAIALAGCTTMGPSPVATAGNSVLALGDNGLGDPCQANRLRGDDALNSPFDQSFSITCRGSAANQSLGYVRSFVVSEAATAKAEARLTCGTASQPVLAGIGAVSARLCHDERIEGDVVAVEFAKGDRVYHGTAAALAVAPMIAGLQRLSGQSAMSDHAAGSIDLAGLARPTVAQSRSTAAAAFDPQVALRQGVAYNRRGLHSDASRVLNDALSRLGADPAPSVRTELLLEAGLADSNIRFVQTADEHFARANALLQSGTLANQNFLLRKRDIYRALDMLNRRQFPQALVFLDRLGGTVSTDGNPLENIATVQSLNQSASTDLARSINAPDEEIAAQLLLQTQANWARSVALIQTRNLNGAALALNAADASFAPLRSASIDQTPLYWLDSRLQRQRGRLLAAQGNWREADDRFGAAMDLLVRSAVGSAGTANEPGIAEIGLERAAVVLRSGADIDSVRTRYREAIAAALATGATSGGAPAEYERYLDLLVADDRPLSRQQNEEDFFQAIQAIGEPAVARQISNLRSQLDSDPAIGARLRDRADLQRESARLGFEIGAAAQSNPSAVEDLTRRRDAVALRLRTVENELAANSLVASVEERPVTLEDIRSALRPGEVYFKVSEVNGRVYSLLIGKEESFIYRAIGSASDLATTARRVRESIDVGLRTTGRLDRFDVARSYDLFRRLTGPATDAMLAATRIVVDPSGPLERLPLGVLVTDAASVAALRNRRSDRDFSAVAFLARRATISNSVSPRSFLVARGLPASRARQPFIGFASPVEPQATSAAATVNLGTDCNVPFSELHARWDRLGPIDPREVTVAATALQTSNPALLVGQQFTDTAVAARRDLSDFKVLHFATHGFEEGRWGCANSPPALLTSLADGDSNGVLSYGEIARLRLDANLVFLSACDTGSGVSVESVARQSGQEEVGSTLEGLVRSFLSANARSVVATHWPVSAGQESIDFVDAFYTAARAGTIATSLQAAQVRLIESTEFSHPYYWGAYFVVGDADKSLMAGQALAEARTDSGGVSPSR